MRFYFSFSLLLCLILWSPTFVQNRAYNTPPVGFIKHNSWAICKDCNFYGHDLNWYYYRIHSYEDCARTCIWYGPECTHFVFRQSPRYCFLKSGRVDLRDAYPDPNKSYFGGIRCSQVKTGTNPLKFSQKRKCLIMK